MKLAQLDEDGFEGFVRSGPALAGFWAEWALPSRSLGPLLEAVAADFDGRLRVGIADHDASPTLAARYRIQGLPTLILFNGGAEVLRRVGVMARADLYPLLEAHLANRTSGGQEE